MEAVLKSQNVSEFLRLYLVGLQMCANGKYRNQARNYGVHGKMCWT